jgi:error-prone DNA polymerase
MPLSEEVVADYQTQRLSLKAHPMAFLRPALAERGFVRAADLRARKFRSAVQVAGVVLIRQRPGSAKGVCFITIEDESGVANLVIWPDVMEKQRKIIMSARLMEVRGRVEYDDEVIHVIVSQLTDATASLHALSDDMLSSPVARADHVSRPLPSRSQPSRFQPEEWQAPGPANRDCGWSHGHPRCPDHPRFARFSLNTEGCHPKAATEKCLALHTAPVCLSGGMMRTWAISASITSCRKSASASPAACACVWPRA